MPVYENPVPPTSWQAQDYGMGAYTFDPTAAATTSTPLTPAGTMFVMRMYLAKRALISNIYLYVITAGGTLTANQCGAALYGPTGALLSNTALTQSTNWNSTGPKTIALLAAQDCAAGFYHVAAFYNGTTGPAFLRSAGPAVNLNLAAADSRNATADTGRTTTFPSTLGTKTASAVGYWAGIG